MTSIEFPYQAIELNLITPLQLGELIPRGTRITVFQQIYWVFLILGTIVGIVVIAYMLQKAYKYRDTGDTSDDGVQRPKLGELPGDTGGGKKLFVSFSMSAIIVISLIIWTYGTLLYVENAPAQEADAIEVNVVGYQFGWEFEYPNGKTTNGELRVPVDRMIQLEVTSRDVFHNFGIPELRVKTDAMPGQTTKTWFRASETGEYNAYCYELCGAGHSFMTAQVIVMEPDAYNEWYTSNSTAS